MKLYSGNSDNIKEQIDRGLIDIGLLVEPVDISKYNFARTPFKERWGVLVNEDSELARCRTGCAITIELNCSYDALRFIPFQPALETGTGLVWKKTQIFSPAANAFIDYIRHYLSELHS